MGMKSIENCLHFESYKRACNSKVDLDVADARHLLCSLNDLRAALLVDELVVLEGNPSAQS